MDYESASHTCPKCGGKFDTLADEYGTFPCPCCGFEPRWFDEELEDEQDDEQSFDPLSD